MGKRSQVERRRDANGMFLPVARVAKTNAAKGAEWRRDLLLSWLFHTCITLQTSLNRRFLRFGMTVQEASVLIRCVEARKTSPGSLALVLGRDPGKVTRFIDRLELNGFVKREVNPRDRRSSTIRPTAKGKQLVRELAPVFASVRKELFAGILESDITRLSSVLPRLRRNATLMGSARKTEGVRRRRRVRVGSRKPDLQLLQQHQITEPGECVPPHVSYAGSGIGPNADRDLVSH
jgi:DNA-binding MarR family transcriptional regulator